ncbi:hypothetical protein EF910_32075 [Streptomyces sp. WAC07149]|uniref:hypothetical protein n=1 Tax=Streptomyces sp. WAC07149 TaxID=2487425 RepID=UPI000F7959C9|nr:hypothetical protein [Streptomyces sp. WAC07149]RST00374.1 hypothetical protein EF910_32075 [Streptomyces sp. WAC07149]
MTGPDLDRAKDRVVQLLRDKAAVDDAAHTFGGAVRTFGQHLREAKDEESWRSLGYAGWGEFVETQLDITRRHAYNLMDKGLVESAITGTLDHLGVKPFHTVDLQHRDVQAVKKHLPELTATISERVQEVIAEGQELDEDTVNGIVTESTATVSKNAKKAKAAANQPVPEPVVDVPPIVDNRTPEERERMDAMDIADSEAFLIRDAAAHKFLADLGNVRRDLKRMSERVGDDLERSADWQKGLAHEVGLMAVYLDVLNRAATDSPGHGSTGDQAEKWVNSLEES